MSEITIIFGHVGRDPELRIVTDGKAVCNFPVAVNQGKDRPAKWFRVSVWDVLAETCHQYVRKGLPVQVTGTVRASAWLDNQHQAQAALELSAYRVDFGGARSDVERAADGPEPVETIPF